MRAPPTATCSQASWRAIRALAVLGDFNVAPEDRDVHDPARGQGRCCAREPERAAFRDWLGARASNDSFRLFEQPDEDVQLVGLPAARVSEEHGLRIDHILLSPALAARCTACRIDRNARKGERPSDHAPVIVELAP